jgi:hypothetical protein
MSSIIYAVGGTDKTLILDTRASLLQQFSALNWTDLRLTMAISLTAASAPDQQTGLAEIVGAGADADIAYIGFKSSDANLPRQTNFYGMVSHQESLATTPSQLVNQGAGTGIYQFGTSNSILQDLLASNGTTRTQPNVGAAAAASPRLQNGDGAFSGYATVISLRMRRNDPTLPIATTLEVMANFTPAPNQPMDDNVLYHSATDIPTLRAIAAAGTFVIALSNFAFNLMPDSIYVYWPFMLSRLRVHSYVLEKYG